MGDTEMIQLFYHPTLFKGGFPGGTSGKEPACQRRRHKRRGFDPWVRKIPWSFFHYNSCVNSGNHRDYSEICPTELGNEARDIKISSKWIRTQNALGTPKIFYKQFRLKTINLE